MVTHTRRKHSQSMFNPQSTFAPKPLTRSRVNHLLPGLVLLKLQCTSRTRGPVDPIAGVMMIVDNRFRDRLPLGQASMVRAAATGGAPCLEEINRIANK